VCNRAMIVIYVVYARCLPGPWLSASITARTGASPDFQSSSMTSDSSSCSGGGTGSDCRVFALRPGIYDEL
jgi:hypothetical protein